MHPMRFLLHRLGCIERMGMYFLLRRQAGDATWVILPVVAVVGAVMLLFAVLFGAVEKSDLQMLPAGERLCAFLKKCKLLK